MCSPICQIVYPQHAYGSRAFAGQYCIANDVLESMGIVGPQPGNSSKPRDILMDEEGAFEALKRARTGGLFDEE